MPKLESSSIISLEDRKKISCPDLTVYFFLSSTLGKKYETVTVVSGYKVYMKLRIRNVNEIDFMQYKCVAKNALGYSDGSITLYGT